MEIKGEDFLKLIRFQLNRSIVNLYKDFLNAAEDLKRDRQINETQYQILRKRILDKGNDCIRELDTLIDKMNDVINTGDQNELPNIYTNNNRAAMQITEHTKCS